jgi:hypothetical protein
VRVSEVLGADLFDVLVQPSSAQVARGGVMDVKLTWTASGGIRAGHV